jgi:hypothetical protein
MKFLKENLIPVMFSAVTITTMLNLYVDWAPFFVIPSLAFAYLVFFICTLTSRLKNKLSQFLTFTCSLAFSFAFFRFGPGFVGLLRFEVVSFSDLLMIFAFSITLFSAAVFYFTRMRFNSFFLLLLLFIPCMLYAKQLTTLQPVYLGAVIALFFATTIDAKKYELSLTSTYVNTSKYANALYIVVCLVFSLVMILPHATTTPYDYFRSLYQNYDDFALQSGQGYFSQDEPERPLFEVRSDAPLYLKRQVFGRRMMNSWVILQDSMRSGWENWEAEQSSNNVENFLQLFDQVGELDASFREKYGTPPHISVQRSTAFVKHLGLIPVYLPHPEETYSVQGINPIYHLYRTLMGEIFLMPQRLAKDAEYTLYYYIETTGDLPATVAYLSSWDYGTLLRDMEEIIERSGDYRQQDLIQVFAADWEAALAYMLATDFVVPERISNLALQVTEGMTNDLEKAEAIVDYFKNNGFVYDLSYVPPERYFGDVEYFIFTDKRGTCSNYASAMTMMARAVGLKIRYVEGFFAGSAGDTPVVVTTKNAHAYTEVFLPGYGWLVFEPTVSYTEEADTASFDQWLKGMSLLLPLTLLLLLVLLYWYKAIKQGDWLFRRRLLREGSEEAVQLLYTRTLRLIESEYERAPDPLTPRMLAEMAAERYSVDLAPLTEIVEAQAYEETPAAKESVLAAFAAYRRLKPAIKLRRKLLKKFL